jgi:hypothetical protein
MSPVAHSRFTRAGVTLIVEDIALEWRDIDFPAGNMRVWRSSWFAVVGTTKGGRARTVPITRRLAATLEAQLQDRSTLVFWTKAAVGATA